MPADSIGSTVSGSIIHDDDRYAGVVKQQEGIKQIKNVTALVPGYYDYGDRKIWCHYGFHLFGSSGHTPANTCR